MRRFALVLILAVTAVLAGYAVSSPAPAHAAGQTIAVTPGAVATGNTVTVSGSGFTPNNWAFVYWQRPDGSTNAVWVATDASGNFSFTLGFLAAHGTGTEWVIAYDYAAATWSGWQSVTVTAGSGGGGGGGGAAEGQLSANPSAVTLPSPTEHFTAQTTVTGTGFTPNNSVWVQWTRPDGSTGGGWINSDGAGSFSFALSFDPAHHCGQEALQAYGNATGTWSAAYMITVHCGL